MANHNSVQSTVTEPALYSLPLSYHMGSRYDIMAFHFSRSSHFSAKRTERCHNVCATNIRTRLRQCCMLMLICIISPGAHVIQKFVGISRSSLFFFFRGSNASLELRNYHKVRLFWRRVCGTVLASHSRNVIKVIIDILKMASFWQNGELFLFEAHACSACRLSCRLFRYTAIRSATTTFPFFAIMLCLFVYYCGAYGTRY